MSRSLQQIVAGALAGPREAWAISFEGREHDWGWIADLADSLTACVAASGAPTDEPVGFIPRQRPEAAAAFLGLVAAGRSMTMIYSYQTVEAMAADVRKLRTAVVVAHAQDWTEPLVAAAKEVGAAGVSLQADGVARAVPGLERVGAGEHRAAPAEPSIELLTSGTTGPPKRHPIPFEQFRRCMLESDFELAAGAAAQRPAHVFVPIANISGIYTFLDAAARRRPVILDAKFTLAGWLDYVGKHKPTALIAPPAMLKMALDADVPREALGDGQFVTIGMGPLDPHLRRQFEARYGIPILPCYGATEFVGAATAVSLDDQKLHGEAIFDSVGRPVRGVTIRIRDPETDELVGPEAVGIVEIQHEGIGPDWIRTTDLGRLDANGFLYLHGRADGVINRGGFKIHPSTIESALLQHPQVRACAVVGRPDERLGAVPVAAIEAKPGQPRPEPTALDTFLRERLPATNIPVDYRIVDELPRTPSLKVRLDAVKALFA